MTPFRNHLKTPEEIELGKKRTELAHFQMLLTAQEQSFSALRQEIRIFEHTYEEILGVRITALEDLEWQLKGLMGSDEIAETSGSSAHADTFTCFHHQTDLLDDDDAAPVHTSALKSMKSLYREVAKAIHPDLASDDEQRMRRQELMAMANQAYEEGDRSVLEDILCDWELGPELVSEMDVALELVRVIRQIARVQQNIHAAGQKTEELKATDIYAFKIRVDEAMADGIDLMAELAATVDLNIFKAKRRLAALMGIDDTMDDSYGHPLETRLLRFPADRSYGTLYERGLDSVDYRDWQRIGNARGAREVLKDKAVRLDVKSTTADDLVFLTSQQPDDLQALFLYDIDDSSLVHLKHLSGLQELYLSNTSVTDEGLWQLAALHGLRRLYIYHTAITDAGLLYLSELCELKWLTCSGTAITEWGLNRFRQALPGCKAVNFEWRHGK